MTTVLIAIDDTEESKRAARVAVDCFGSGADYLAIYVDQDRPVAGPLWGPDVIWGGIYTYPGLYTYPITGSPRVPGEWVRTTAAGSSGCSTARRATTCSGRPTFR